MANEKPEDWLKTVKKYCDKPIDQNKERVTKVAEVACQHEVDMESASILYAAKEQTEN